MTNHSVCPNLAARLRSTPQSSRLSTVRCVRSLVLGLVWLLALALQSSAQELSNDRLTLRLNFSPEGIPIIKEAVWQATGQLAFRDLGTPDGLNNWVPTVLIPTAPTPPSAWEISEADGSCALPRALSP